MMSIARKIFFVAASFALPIVVLGFLVVRNINEHIAFAQRELAGTAYQRPLDALLRDIQEHQRLARHCPEHQDCARQLASLKEAVHQELLALRSVNSRYGVVLQFTGEGLAKRGRQLSTADNLQRAWERLESAPAYAKPGLASSEMDSRYDGMVNIIQTMILHVNDTSNLILDPELDTFHLIADTSMLLPKTQERLARVTAAGLQALSRGNAREAERMALAAHAAFLEQADRDQIKLHLDTALSENKNEFHGAWDSFQQDVPAAYAEYADAATRFIDLTEELATSAFRQLRNRFRLRMNWRFHGRALREKAFGDLAVFGKNDFERAGLLFPLATVADHRAFAVRHDESRRGDGGAVRELVRA